MMNSRLLSRMPMHGAHSFECSSMYLTFNLVSIHFFLISI